MAALSGQFHELKNEKWILFQVAILFDDLKFSPLHY